MKGLLYISFAFLLSGPVNYEKVFHSEYDNAVSFIKQNHEGFNKILKTDADKKNLMISIIFPELIRYSLFKDFFETKSLELGYVQYGAKLVDFSIGRFQMKPSFVEALEEDVKYSENLMNKYCEITAYKDETITGIRKERIERLSSLDWQLIYLECFYDIISEKFKDIKWQDDVEKLKFYATAYNHNFCASKQEIEKWINAKTFPYGASYEGEQYSYSDISVYFYNNHF
ncbi:MAG: hypothetical protein FVQ77_13960 [Cytophagales bacterium]|nr:hypothetical protein [Cytophagales bacterium]